jgi:hypothetical protein
MRKIVAGLITLVLVVGIVFYLWQIEPIETPETTTVTWETPQLAAATQSERLSDTLTFETITVPIPYGTVKHLGTNASMAVGYSELISITPASAFETYFRMYGFTDTETQATCDFLSHTSDQPVCDSNYLLYQAFLTLEDTDINLFSSDEQKTLYRKLTAMRGDLLPAQTIAPLDVEISQGFLFTVTEREFVVHLFDSNDQPYQIRYSGISADDVIFSVSNLEIE